MNQQKRRRIFPIPYPLSPIPFLLLLTGCLSPYGQPGRELHRKGDEIIVCGRLFHTGTRVVLWTDPGGFDAYRVYRRFSQTDQLKPTSPTDGTETPNRYSPMRGGLPDAMARRVNERGWALSDLQQVVDQFVIHYDVCGTSRKCFEVLHDVRGLSVHFMLDVDGTIYQTLDLKERARHAGTANDRSVGVEIANMGAYADPRELSKWYATDADGRVRLILPADWQPFDAKPGEGPRIFRPARSEIIRGRINGAALYQYDFTPQQYAALSHLSAALANVFPRISLNIPRESVCGGTSPFGPLMWWMTAADAGCVRTTVLPPKWAVEYRGLLGHYHVTSEKFDPGPAFDWERVLTEARRLR